MATRLKLFLCATPMNYPYVSFMTKKKKKIRILILEAAMPRPHRARW